MPKSSIMKIITASKMNDTKPIVLDLDGVILKSNFIKHKAMLSLFDDHPSKRARISAYNLANGGVRRDHKLRHILTYILETPPTAGMLAHYLTRYAVALEHQLALAPLVDGVKDFLAGGKHPFYVSSSAPEAEVHEQLARRGLVSYFTAIFGADTPKVSALRQVTARHPGMVPIFFGDAVGDWEAACAAGVKFIAVVCERDNFTGRPVTKLTDFSSLETVYASIQSALIAPAA